MQISKSPVQFDISYKTLITSEIDNIGFSLSTVDINGDGLADSVFSATDDGTRNYGSNSDGFSGITYIVFGQTREHDEIITASSLNGSNGFSILGIDAQDSSGHSVSGAGDINGDGIEDLIIGAPMADPNGLNSGESYVVFGSREARQATFNLSQLNGVNGFQINGINPGDEAGRTVSQAGDINGDGIDDLLIAAPGNYGSESNNHIIFGKTTEFDSTLELSSLDGSNGFRIISNERTSISQAGDINGDGLDDLIIGAPFTDRGNQNSVGAGYLILGQSQGFNSSVDLSNLDDSQAIKIQGAIQSSSLGDAVTGIGDFNGDGLDDVLISNSGISTDATTAGAYVIYGQQNIEDFPNNIDEIQPSQGFIIHRDSTEERYSSFSLGRQSGDINGDGFDDILLTVATGSDDHYRYTQQTSYIIFGSSKFFENGIILTDIHADNDNFKPGFSINVGRSRFSETSASIVTDINGDGFDDILLGDSTAYAGYYEGSGAVIFGQDSPNVLGSPLNGSNKEDLLRGADGNDLVQGFAGNDTLFGDRDQDTIIGGSGDDEIQGNADNDILFGNRGDDTIIGGFGDDQLKGGREKDYLEGSIGDDQLFGGADDDQLLGGNGNDLLVGGTGHNLVSGGGGRDHFQLHRKGFAVIQDFTIGQDYLEMKQAGFRGGLELGRLSSDQFVLGSVASHEQHRFIFDTDSGRLFFDADGNRNLKKQVAIAEFTNKITLNAHDIQIV